MYTFEQSCGVALQSTYRRYRFWHLFRWSSFWSWRACKQAKLSHLGRKNPHAYIKKPTHPKWVTVFGSFFFENEQGEAVTVNGDRYRAMLNEFLRRILAKFGFNRTALRATQPNPHSMFCVLFSKIALSAAYLMSFGHLGAAIWHRWTIICEVPSKISVTLTIDSLKDNIREAIGEIQLHTNDNVFKNWTDRVGYCMTSRFSHLNEIISHY